MRESGSKGFSIIELIVVIVLLGILAAVVFPRMLGPSGFEEAGARDAVISIARGAQQLALGRSDVTFRIEQAGGEWLFTARAGGDVLRSARIPAANVSLETGATTAGLVCASDFSIPVSNSFTVSYDSLGNATEFSNGGPGDAVSNGVRICINRSTALSVCISPGGYAHQGDCLD